MVQQTIRTEHIEAFIVHAGVLDIITRVVSFVLTFVLFCSESRAVFTLASIKLGYYSGI